MLYSLKLGHTLLNLQEPRILGILNVTPDSFFAGSRAQTLSHALRRAEQLLTEGADVLDLGAYSSRPGAAPVDLEQESERLLPIINALIREFPHAPLSIDTFRAEIARRSVDQGAHLINDISGGDLDPQMYQTVADLQVPYILMHMRGTPQDMQTHTDYEDVVEEINLGFAKKIARLRALGVRDIVLDPGFGFAKTLEQNYQVLSRFEELHLHGLPILGAISRKSMIYKALDTTPEEALNGSSVLHSILLQKGAKLLRVHDVREAKETIRLCQLAQVLP